MFGNVHLRLMLIPQFFVYRPYGLFTERGRGGGGVRFSSVLRYCVTLAFELTEIPKASLFTVHHDEIIH